MDLVPRPAPIGLHMGLLLILLGFAPLLFLGDLFTGPGTDASDATGDGQGDEAALPPASLASLVDDPVQGVGQPLKPVTEDPAPFDGAPVDPATVIHPNAADDIPIISDAVDPETVIDPVDAPGEGYVSGDGSTLQNLIDRESDFRLGIGWLGDRQAETHDSILGDDDTLAILPQGDAVAATLADHDGTPVLAADGAVEVIDAGGGADTLILGGAPSYAFGGEGDDQIAATTGVSAQFGGAGNDVLSGGSADTFMDGGIGDDTLLGGSGDDVLFGGSHDDTGATLSDDDLIDGGAGDDRIAGGYGADMLSGGDGDDLIDHHGRVEQTVVWERNAFAWHIDNAADTLDGGAGSDTLVMDRADTATGGEGLDTFWVYHDEAQGSGAAEITDFQRGADFLRVSLNPELDHGELSVDVSASEDGADSLVSVNGELVAILRGTPDATASDVLVEVTPDIFA